MSRTRRNAIVTGAASGLGRAVAVRLARDGWRVAVCDIDDRASRETLDLVQAAGGEGRVERLDVTCHEQWQALRHRLQAEWAELDLLVNNAGVAAAGEIGVCPLADWRWVLDVNLWGGIYGCHTFVEWLKQNPRGSHLIITASIAATESAPPTAAYNVAKAGLVSLAETLYAQLLPHGVGVTVLCPASFPTKLNESLRVSDEHWRKSLEDLSDRAALTADQVAEQALRAMRRKRLYVLAPVSARLRWYLKRLAPQTFMRGVSRAVYRHSRGSNDGEQT